VPELELEPARVRGRALERALVRERVPVRERVLVRVLGQERERAPGPAPGRPSVRTQWQSTHQ